jgi:hypothetical protein
MRKLIFVFALGCGGANTSTVQQTPRPLAAEGGIRAEPPAVQQTWVNLGVPVEVSPIQRQLEVAGQGGAIDTLLIKGVSGELEISQVEIEFMDKSTKKVDLNRRFIPGDGQVIELREQRPIGKIIVYIDPDSNGVFEILGA